MRLAMLSFLLFLNFTTQAGASQPVCHHKAYAREVLNAKSLILSDGQIVRLLALQAPNIAGNSSGSEPFAEDARSHLRWLVIDKELCLHFDNRRKDRKGRLLAHIFLPSGTWVQKAMLRAGMAYLYSFADNRRYLDILYDAEMMARKEKAGIWSSPYFAPIPHHAAWDQTDRHRIVTGRVQDVAEVRGDYYLNFGEDWRRDFTIFIPKEAVDDFSASELLPFHALKGKKVEVRGWIFWRNGPMIEATHAEQLHVKSTTQ